jgi:hypothetical protein
MDEALQQKVVLCSPFTLYAMLSVVRQAHENFRYEKDLHKIIDHIEKFIGIKVFFARIFDVFKKLFYFGQEERHRLRLLHKVLAGSREVVIAHHFDGTLGKRDEPVVVLVHEAAMIFLVPPHVKRSVLAFFVGTEQRMVPDEALMLRRFPLPHAAVFRINGNVLFLDLKKHHVDEHGTRGCLAEQRPGLFPDDAVGVQIVAALERLDRFFCFGAHVPINGARVQAGSHERTLDIRNANSRNTDVAAAGL